MNPLKARQKYLLASKLFDSSTVSHPESNASQLIDSIIVGTNFPMLFAYIILKKNSKSVVRENINNGLHNPKSARPQLS